jgi:hypothetical protein
MNLISQQFFLIFVIYLKDRIFEDEYSKNILYPARSEL